MDPVLTDVMINKYSEQHVVSQAGLDENMCFTY